jgi:hypothetical protein
LFDWSYEPEDFVLGEIPCQLIEDIGQGADRIVVSHIKCGARIAKLGSFLSVESHIAGKKVKFSMIVALIYEDRLPSCGAVSEMIPLTSPFTANSLKSIKQILSIASLKTSPNVFDSNERNAAVLIPFCNVNGKPGILFEVRGKLRTHSGEVRCEITTA